MSVPREEATHNELKLQQAYHTACARDEQIARSRRAWIVSTVPALDECYVTAGRAALPGVECG